MQGSQPLSQQSPASGARGGAGGESPRSACGGSLMSLSRSSVHEGAIALLAARRSLSNTTADICQQRAAGKARAIRCDTRLRYIDQETSVRADTCLKARVG